MNLYTVTVNGADNIVQWVGTQADAKAAKREQEAKHPLATVAWQEFEVPTDKAGLLAFLNTRCVAHLVEPASGE